MTLAQKVTVFEAFNRAKTGERVDESTWDYEIIPKTASRLTYYLLRGGREDAAERKWR